MKQKCTITLFTLVLSLFGAACGSAETQVAVEGIETSIVEEYATLDAEKSALIMTQTAVAVPSPTMTVPIPTITVPITLCPLYVYDDYGSDLNNFVPEGWMGDISDITFDDNYLLDPERPNVIQIKYIPTGLEKWAGIYWWDPPGSNWGNKDGGFDLSCATKITFWARGEIGGEKAEFKVGGLDDIYKDSLQPALSTGPIVLTNSWVQYTLQLAGEDLSHIIGGFVWVTNKPSNPNGATIYLDEIKFEE